VPKYYAAVRLELRNPNPNPRLDFLSGQVAHQLLLLWGTFTPISFFLNLLKRNRCWRRKRR